MPKILRVGFGANGSCPIWIKVLAKSKGCVAAVTPKKSKKLRNWNLWNYFREINLPILKAIWGIWSFQASASLKFDDQPTGNAFRTELWTADMIFIFFQFFFDGEF